MTDEIQAKMAANEPEVKLMEQIAAINDMSFGEVCDRFLDRTLDAKLCKRIAEIAMRGVKKEQK